MPTTCIEFSEKEFNLKQSILNLFVMYKFVPKNSILVFSMVLLTIAVTPYLTQNVFAASGISSAVANDPDDADNVYSVGDTIIITFPAQVNSTFAGLTMSNTEFRANFTVAPSDIDTADTLTGVWNAGATAVTLTINTIAGSTPPIVNTDTFEYDPTLGNIHYQTNGTEFTAATVTLTGDFGLFIAAVLNNGGGGCSGDCIEPTLGVNNEGKRLVDGGFTYNGNPIDVELFFTPYPLVTVQTGKENTAEFKIYDNYGPDNISHFELAFGLARGESIGTSKVVINWDKSFDGIETVTLDDPENVLENIKVITFEGSCSDGQSQKCLVIQVVHTFRAPLDFNILGTNVWDMRRNAWQNYYNHGIEIVGESLNPPKEYDGINKGHIYHLTETGKNTAVDEFGNAWTLNKTWIKNYIKNERSQDTGDMKNRNHSSFGTWKQMQGDYAIKYFDSSKIQGIDKGFIPAPERGLDHREQTLQKLDWYNTN